MFVHIFCAPVGLVFLERRFDVRWAGGDDWGGMRKLSDAQEKYRVGIEGNKICDTAKVGDGSLRGSFDRDCAFKPQIYDGAKARL